MKKTFLILAFIVSNCFSQQTFFEIQPASGVRIDEDHLLARGLVLVPAFQQGYGSVIYDLSFHGNNGTLTTMTVPDDWVFTPLGYGLNFDGTDDNINFGSAPNLDNIEPLSISFWVNFVTGNTQDQILGKNTSGGSGQWRVEIASGSGNSIRFLKDLAGTDPTATWNGVATDGAWHHFVITWDGTNNSSTTGIAMYKNGVFLTPSGTTGGGTLGRSDAALDFILGDPSTGLDGTVTCVYLWGGRLLTQDEVTLLYYIQYDIFEKRRRVISAAVAAARRVIQINP